MKKAAFVILALSVSLHFCGRDKKTGLPGGQDTPGAGRAPASAKVQAGPAHGGRPFIKNIVYNSESLDSQTDLTATPVLETPAAEDVEFRFHWYVNGEEVPADSGVLDKKYFKKNDWIYCSVTAAKDGETSNVFRADYIRVPNTPPELAPAPIPAFTVPGTFSYQVLASDIDGDKLSFKLLSPLDRNIEMDEATGLVRWEIDRDLAAQLASPVIITFEVSDPDGGKVTSAISLDFSGTKR